MLKTYRSAFLASLLALPAASIAKADGAQDFVTANIISTLYHEFGHALIDATKAPVSGDPEHGADILAVAILDALWEEDPAESITALTALSFELAAQENENPTYWHTHNLDMQRYYDQVCLFYGANPASRASLAEEFDISAKRSSACVTEYTNAATSWAAALIPTGADKSDKTNQFNGDTTTDITTLMADEMRDLNASYALPQPVTAKLAACGEENAFYDPKTNTITICTEYVDFLQRQAIANDL